MTYVLALADEPEFSYSSQLIKSLHFMMTSYSLRNRPGQWRAGSIYVRNDTTGAIVYEAPDLDDVPELMNELMDELNSEGQTPVLVRACMSHLNLVMIHPFRDGNGRMARCLQSLVLARSRVLSPVFMSIEEYLGRNTDDYYRLLSQVGQGVWSPANDSHRWLRFMLTAHLRQAKTMLRRVRESERLWVELERITSASKMPERVISALFDAASGLRVRNSTYRAALENTDEEIGDQAATRDLRELVNAGLLVPNGKARGRFYVAGPAVTSLRSAILAGREARDDSDPFAS